MIKMHAKPLTIEKYITNKRAFKYLLLKVYTNCIIKIKKRIASKKMRKGIKSLSMCNMDIDIKILNCVRIIMWDAGMHQRRFKVCVTISIILMYISVRNHIKFRCIKVDIYVIARSVKWAYCRFVLCRMLLKSKCNRKNTPFSVSIIWINSRCKLM